MSFESEVDQIKPEASYEEPEQKKSVVVIDNGVNSVTLLNESVGQSIRKDSIDHIVGELRNRSCFRGFGNRNHWRESVRDV